MNFPIYFQYINDTICIGKLFFFHQLEFVSIPYDKSKSHEITGKYHMTWTLIINLSSFILFIILIGFFQGKQWTLSKRVLISMLLGILFGFFQHRFYGSNTQIVTDSIAWFNIVGNGYVKLLQMVVMPLVFVSVLSAVAKLHHTSSLGKISLLTIGTLLCTTAIAALVAVWVTTVFGLTAEGLIQGTQETQRLIQLEENYIGQVNQLNVPELIVSFIPSNPFAELTGAHPTSIISVVIFAVFLGLAALQMHKAQPEHGLRILKAIECLQFWIMKLVRIVINLTPYGVFALMTIVVMRSNLTEIIKLGGFLLASYLGLMIMFLVHAIFLRVVGISPLKYFKKVWPVLSFAFTSRSSAATIPLNIETQTRRLGIPESIASFSASFGTTIGQNGCAGLYPAMLAVMIAPTVGINPLEPTWIAMLVFVVTLSSIGVAGVGGGATFAALIVLPTLGLPVTLVALLISIEPLIDMGRTALNVNGAMTAGMITSQILGQTNQDRFNQEESPVTPM